MATLVEKLQPTELQVSDLSLENAWFKKVGESYKYKLPDVSADANILTEESKVSVSKIDEFDVSLVSGNDGKFLKYVDATGKIELAAESNAINDYSVSLDKIEKDANKLGYIIHRDVNNDGKVIADNEIVLEGSRISCNEPVWQKSGDEFFANSDDIEWYESWAENWYRTCTTTTSATNEILTLTLTERMRLVLKYQLTSQASDESGKFHYEEGTFILKMVSGVVSKSDTENELELKDGFTDNLPLIVEFDEENGAVILKCTNDSTVSVKHHIFIEEMAMKI